MDNREAVNWLINISADIGKAEHSDLWHYEQALTEIKDMLESAQPVATDTNVGDIISRQTAINTLCSKCTVDKPETCSTIQKGDNWCEEVYILQRVPSAQSETPCYLGSPCEYQNPDVVISQPEPSISLSWIKEHIEWLKSLDNEFANLAAAHISVMVKKWRGEQDDSV